ERLELLVGALQLFVCREQLFIGGLKLLVGALEVFDDQLQLIFRLVELGLQRADVFFFMGVMMAIPVAVPIAVRSAVAVAVTEMVLYRNFPNNEHGEGHAGGGSVGSSARSDKDLDGYGAVVFLVADIFQIGLFSRLFGLSDLRAEEDGNRRWDHPQQIEVQLAAGQGQESFIGPDGFPDLETGVDIKD